METAVTYQRISIKEQSRHSKEGQRRANEEHCERNGWAVLASFDDDSTGSNFDRPGWTALVAYIKRHRPNYVVVMAYDRLSRDASESLAIIERMEKRYGCFFISVTQALPVSRHSPFFFKMRADLLVGAEFELKVIGDRAQFGRYNAARQGRFSAPAPYGYDNARDAAKKPILVVNEAEAAVVSQMFADYVNGMSYAEVLRGAKARGFTARHNDAVQRVLKNPIYCGKIVVPPYYGAEAYIVQGLHTGIVDERTYWKAQELISGGKKKVYQPCDDVFLRGALYCETCGFLMTSSQSRGNGGVYNYYFCHRHPGRSYRVEHVHAELSDILRQLSFDEVSIARMREMARSEMTRALAAAAAEVKTLRERVADLTRQIDSVEEKLIANVVNKDVYDKWKPRLEVERTEARERIAALERADGEAWELFERGIGDIGRLDVVFGAATMEEKHHILGLVFGPGLKRVENGFRTDYVLPVFQYKALQINALQVDIKNETPPNSGEVSVSTPYGNSSEPFTALINLFARRRLA